MLCSLHALEAMPRVTPTKGTLRNGIDLLFDCKWGIVKCELTSVEDEEGEERIE